MGGNSKIFDVSIQPQIHTGAAMFKHWKMMDMVCKSFYGIYNEPAMDFWNL